jgi:hypothetical protein
VAAAGRKSAGRGQLLRLWRQQCPRCSGRARPRRRGRPCACPLAQTRATTRVAPTAFRPHPGSAAATAVRWRNWLTNEERSPAWNDICHTAARRRDHLEHRLALAAASAAEAAAQLTAFCLTKRSPIVTAAAAARQHAPAGFCLPRPGLPMAGHGPPIVARAACFSPIAAANGRCLSPLHRLGFRRGASLPIRCRSALTSSSRCSLPFPQPWPICGALGRDAGRGGRPQHGRSGRRLHRRGAYPWTMRRASSAAAAACCARLKGRA